jgi:hypothetical protein
MLFKVWGERNSGTTYMRELLTVNFPNQNLEYNVDYKNNQLYQGDKILIRKTGEGINATFDNQNYYVIQVIYTYYT